MRSKHPFSHTGPLPYGISIYFTEKVHMQVCLKKNFLRLPDWYSQTKCCEFSLNRLLHECVFEEIDKTRLGGMMPSLPGFLFVLIRNARIRNTGIIAAFGDHTDIDPFTDDSLT